VAVTPTTAEAGLFRPVVAHNSGNTSTPYATYTSRTDTAAAYADFSQSLEPYNANQQGSSAGAYTVRAGDTLQGIAAALYGDSNLWYRIAEANGLSGGASLTEGQSLNLPGGITTEFRGHYTN
jgi:nucleoid-associated protein YgaU